MGVEKDEYFEKYVFYCVEFGKDCGLSDKLFLSDVDGGDKRY